MLEQAGQDTDAAETLIAALADGAAEGQIGEADQAMLAYAAKLTETPWAMTRDDVGALRTAGFSDQAVLDIAQVTGYYAFVNRLADGLGVELESIWDE